MKTKKILSAACAAILVCSFTVTAFTGCNNNKCEHEFNWTVQTEPTCTTEGERTGVCVNCGDVVTETIPVNPEAHVYGDWQIKDYPTASDKGSAVKTCTENTTHVLNAELPALTDSKYTVEIITPATVVREGQSQYTYPNDNGDIVFVTSIPKKTISNVEDAVALAVENVGEIGKVAGVTVIPLSGKPSESKYYYEFGDDFTHIISDGDSKEFYCTNEGSFYAVEIRDVKYSYDSKGYPVSKITSGGEPFHSGINQDYIKGYMLSLGYTGTPSEYGAEQILYTYYHLAAADHNDDFEEHFDVKSDGTVECSFSFGYFNNSNNRFSIITVEFTLYDTLSLKSLNVNSKIYGIINITPDNEYEYGYEKIENGFEYDKYGNEKIKYKYRVKPGCDPIGEERITANQERKQDLEKPVEANPYPKNALLVKYFDLTYKNQSGQTVTVGEDVVEFSAGAPIVFNIVNVQNVADNINKISYDPLIAYLRIGDKDIELGASTGSDNKINVSAVVNNATVTIRCFRMDDLQVVLKTTSGNFERVINIEVGNAQAPSRLISRVNMYYDTGYQWEDYTNVFEDLDIYVGQTLEFTAVAPENEQSYTDASYTSEVTSTNKANADIFENNKFVAAAPGEYEIVLTSTLNSRLNTIMYVNVVAAPTAEELFARNYTAALEDPDRVTAEITFEKRSDTEGTVTISFMDMIEVLVYSFTPASITEGSDGLHVYVAPVLTTSHSSGAELGFSLSINDAYGISLRHMREVGGQYEEVVLVPVAA